jgi:hypothetical protein
MRRKGEATSALRLGEAPCDVFSRSVHSGPDTSTLFNVSALFRPRHNPILPEEESVAVKITLLRLVADELTHSGD